MSNPLERQITITSAGQKPMTYTIDNMGTQLARLSLDKKVIFDFANTEETSMTVNVDNRTFSQLAKFFTGLDVADKKGVIDHNDVQQRDNKGDVKALELNDYGYRAYNGHINFDW